MSNTFNSELDEGWPVELTQFRDELFKKKDFNAAWKPVQGFESFSIDLKDLSLTRKLAMGSTGPLYYGRYKNREVVVKVRWFSEADEEERIKIVKKYIIREIEMFSEIKHENVVEYIGSFFKDSVYCIVMEYIPAGSLGDLIQKSRKPLYLENIVHIALDIARGMAHLHSKGIVHRDLKPDNLLIDAKGKIKITDFGSARSLKDWSDFTGETGTYRWMAPEVMKNKKYNRMIDVYSFGIVFWQLFSLKLPFEDLTPMQAVFSVINKNNRPAFPSNCPTELAQLIERCWKTDPELRPPFFEIVRTLEIFAGIRTNLAVEAWKLFKSTVSYW